VPPNGSIARCVAPDVLPNLMRVKKATGIE